MFLTMVLIDDSLHQYCLITNLNKLVICTYNVRHVYRWQLKIYSQCKELFLRSEMHFSVSSSASCFTFSFSLSLTLFPLLIRYILNTKGFIDWLICSTSCVRGLGQHEEHGKWPQTDFHGHDVSKLLLLYKFTWFLYEFVVYRSIWGWNMK
jgi:hypothetical protein